ncbi:hypothetical protein VZT92_015200 [Zoarces viviparus]|uniref:Cyclin E2 n=1 Tax=Zoarces viviparus TaxID=48416 RepID=A0AAW1EW66_ZOAVI
MSRQSVRMQRCENVPGQRGRASEKQLVLKGVAKPSFLIEAAEKRVWADGDQAPTSTDSLVRPSPLPHLGWGSPEDVWLKMVGREHNYRHSKSFMQDHPSIQPKMRAILLDWLIEVSEAYALNRQTFYLAQDYFDRFMLTQDNIDKGMLQLIGITCLFIASKMEETCPPTLSQMAYVTAGTYYKTEILQMEIIILKALRWNLSPETAVSWLKLYFQLASMSGDCDLLVLQYPQDAYIQMTRLLDLCILNINSLDFEYRVLAAAVLSHFIERETAEKVSGLSGDAVQLCVDWMAPFVESANCFDRAPLKYFAGIKEEDRHDIQSHTHYMTMLAIGPKGDNSRFLTPPNSTEKTCTR